MLPWNADQGQAGRARNMRGDAPLHVALNNRQGEMALGVGEVPPRATLVGGAIVFASVLGKLFLGSRHRSGSGCGAKRHSNVGGGGPD